jgi:2,3-bisphosphoglycerate-dependent phosphoglycerate mutase
MIPLVIVRHGQSTWNLENRFTGWVDVDLTSLGEAEACQAGRALAEAGARFGVVHTSVQLRAIRTAELLLHELGQSWLPVRRHWRLNERHYGALTGLDKAETAARHGNEQVHLWRRSYDVAPPPMPEDHPDNPNDDPRYADLPPELVPRTECLRDVVVRMLPWWYDGIVPDLRARRSVLVVAHGNSLRALVKHLESISDDEIADLNIPTGVPLRYDLDDVTLRPITARQVIGDAEAAAAAAEAVARQAG